MVLRARGKAIFLRLIPILLFAAGLAGMQWAAGMPVTWLWLKAIVVFVAVTTLARLVPWGRLLFRARQGSLLYQGVLFAVFVRHFASVLLTEGRRALTAHSLGAPVRYGPYWFHSLAHAIAALFVRSLGRAERFYAAQWLRGIGE